MTVDGFEQSVRPMHCPECDSARIMRDHESAEIVCMNCGFVIESKIADRGPEWRAFYWFCLLGRTNKYDMRGCRMLSTADVTLMMGDSDIA